MSRGCGWHGLPPHRVHVAYTCWSRRRASLRARHRLSPHPPLPRHILHWAVANVGHRIVEQTCQQRHQRRLATLPRCSTHPVLSLPDALGASPTHSTSHTSPTATEGIQSPRKYIRRAYHRETVASQRREIKRVTNSRGLNGRVKGIINKWESKWQREISLRVNDSRVLNGRVSS